MQKHYFCRYSHKQHLSAFALRLCVHKCYHDGDYFYQHHLYKFHNHDCLLSCILIVSIVIIMVMSIIIITIIIIIVFIGTIAGARFSLVFCVVSDIPHLAHTQTRTHAHT